MRILAGMYSDSETGLYYWYSRYYDPKTGRGISADRMSVAEHVARWQANMGVPGQPPLELNPYVAVANNPLRWTDPSGHAIPVAIAACLSNPACLAAIGVAATGAAIQSSGPVVIDPNQPIPPQLPGYVPESQRRSEARVPADLLPPGPSNVCDKQFTEDRKQCESSCANIATRTTCIALARVKYWICKGGQKPKWPDSGSGGGDGDGPFWSPGGGF